MSSEYLESPAFYRAILTSEWHRIIGLLAVLAAVVVYTILRGIRVEGFNLLWLQTAALFMIASHEILVLRALNRARKGGKDVQVATWVVNVVLESQIPTIALFLLLVSEWMTPYQVLIAPAVLVYFVFIILSILRLSPSLTLLTGTTSALGYLFVTFYVEAKFQNSRAELGGFPLQLYMVYASIIFLAGIIAAAIAAKVRTYVGSALREAELQHKLEQVNHDLEIARTIQQGLLPSQTLKLDDFEIAGWNRPADQTGGDYFDWQSLPDGRVAISLADATGHGIGPALVSASCRAYSRASLLAGADKNGLLDRLNSLLGEDLSANRFVTFAVLFLDPRKSLVKVLSAGHGPMLLYRHRSNEIESLEAHGIPLGMIAGVPYSNATEVSLEPGDMMAVATDGFYEWENKDGEQFGLERLERAIRDSRDCTAGEVIERLRTSVEKFCGGTEQQDDLTAVVLKRKLREAGTA
ncbi:MAG TPA: PP2C family protein-serine/threonine phosphatase [Pyrinomonadaceae bacterium]|nr:PP2C family protein-serine/threonine phosphatase [Pyrinomonadaceae bacterium]